MVIAMSKRLYNVEKPEKSTSSEENPTDRVNLTDGNTAVLEYYESVRHEYDCQTEQKTSYENRSGILLSLLGVLCVYILDKAPIKGILALCNMPLTFLLLVKVVFGFMIYIGLLCSITSLILAISVRKQKFFDAGATENWKLEEERYTALVRLIETYIDAVKNRVWLNEQRGKAYRFALYAMTLTLLSTAIYMSV